MKKIISLIAALLVISGCTNSASGYVKPENQINNPNKVFNRKKVKGSNAKYVESLQTFALDFYKEVYTKDKNRVFSPLSIATCFSMLYDGTNGDTKEELADLLNYNDSFNHLEEIQNMLLDCAINSPANKAYLDVSQSLWSRGVGTFKDDYIKKMTDYYYAELFEHVDFTGNAAQLVADYINHKTNDFLNVKPESFRFNVNTEFVLLNTIYLKSPWAIADLFNKDNNFDSKFFGQNSESTVTFMSGKVEDGVFFKKDAYRIASLDYKYGIKLNILLPDENANYDEILSNRDALNSLLNVNALTDYQQNDISWILPKFKVKNGYDLKEPLLKMGLTDKTFDQPDLSAMTNLTNLYISSATHEAGMEINNEGVEAAAYTQITVETKAAMPKKPEVFRVDHPFAYSITNENGYPLFMGVINQL